MESFDIYYPCKGQEFKDTMRQLVESEIFAMLAQRLFPESTLAECRGLFLGFENVSQFQRVAMMRGCEWVVGNTMSAFTYSGAEHLDGGPCLFVSNHRDIVLDAMMLQYILIGEGRDTSHVVVGTNLFEMPLMALLAKANKMYGISRGGTPREYYDSLMRMSAYLRHLVTERGESAWIAQRNGRTKDGCDRTDPALIKMLAASGDRRHPAEALAAMRIVPVSVSYEWEPCGLLKARELCLRRQGPYAKQPGEDTESIVTGICGFKGRVHFAICPPLGEDELRETQGSFDAVASLIDSRIAAGARRYPNNAAATQLREGRQPEGPEAQAFLEYLDDACRQPPGIDGYRDTLIAMYAPGERQMSNTIEATNREPSLTATALNYKL